MKIALLVFVFCVPLIKVSAQSFGVGNFVVVRIGSGDSLLTLGTAQPVYLDEYTPCGQLVRTINLPRNNAGANRKFTLPISTADYSEGYISLSENKKQLALAGYDANVGLSNPVSNSSTTVNRVVAIIDSNGSVNTSTALSNRFSAVVVRSAVIDSNRIWVSGGSGGVVYTSIGNTGTNNTLITTTTARCLSVVNRKLYASTNASGFRMVSIGSGLPSTTGQVFTNLPGYSTTSNPYQFFLTKLNSGTTPSVLYVADNDSLKKFSLVGNIWKLNGTIGSIGDRYKGLTGVEANGVVTLYAIRRNDNLYRKGGEIVKIVDSTGFDSNFAGINPLIIAQSDSNKVFRSVAMAPISSPSIPTVLNATSSSFTAQLVEEKVNLNWVTNNTSTLEYFDVLRSFDGKNFSSIGKMKAIQSSVPYDVEYRFIDSNPFNGNSFYAVEEVNKNGRKTLYTPIMITKMGEKLDFQVSSLEGDNSISVYVTAASLYNGTFSLYNINGKKLISIKTNINKGSSKLSIPVASLAQGVYVLVLTTDKGYVITKKLIK